MRTIFAEYNPQRNSIDVYTSAGYMLRIENEFVIYIILDGTMQIWVDGEDTLYL